MGRKAHPKCMIYWLFDPCDFKLTIPISGVTIQQYLRMWWNWGAMRAPPVGKTQACFARRSGCRAPQQGDALDLGAVSLGKAFAIPLIVEK